MMLFSARMCDQKVQDICYKKNMFQINAVLLNNQKILRKTVSRFTEKYLIIIQVS